MTTLGSTQVHHNIKDLHVLAEKGLLLWRITDDPLTLSAATLLLKATTSKLTPPQKAAYDLLLLQLHAYEVLYTRPLM